MLNGGTDTFTETFNLPPSDLRQASLHFHQQNDEDENDSNHVKSEDESPLTFDYSAMFEMPVGTDDQYLDFWTGPFGMMPSPSYTDLQLELYDPSIVSPGVQTGSTPSTTTQPSSEQAQYVSALSMAIYNKLWCLALDEKARQELTACLNFLLTADRIRKFISLYFRNWHLNCPIIHKPSFDAAKVPISLVISVVFIGAMYSKDQNERLAAKKLVDVAELVVFDSEIFSFEIEVTRTIQGEPTTTVSDSDREWDVFQELQAGYLMVIAQYWGGSCGSKRRAMQSRLGDVINVARSMQLHHARHLPSDRISEVLWLQKETKIRTISVIALLDCAMRIYSNYPCRITLAELDNDLPCKEAIFSSRHPFMQDESVFASRLTMSQAFALLFDGKSKLSTSTAASVTSLQADELEAGPSDGADAAYDLTIYDLFILIHCKLSSEASPGVRVTDQSTSSLYLCPLLRDDNVAQSTHHELWAGLEILHHGDGFNHPSAQGSVGKMAPALGGDSLTDTGQVTKSRGHVSECLQVLGLTSIYSDQGGSSRRDHEHGGQLR